MARKKRTAEPAAPKLKQSAQRVTKKLRREMLQAWIPHFIAHGMKSAPSIRAAFPAREWTDETARWTAFDLMRDPAFSDIVQAHLTSIDRVVDEQFILDGLYAHSMANVLDYFQVDERGHLQVKDMNTLPNVVQRNIKRLIVTNTLKQAGKDGAPDIIEQRLSIELVDSQKALALLGKAIGMFIERTESDIGPRLAQALEEATERVRRREQPALPTPPVRH